MATKTPTQKSPPCLHGVVLDVFYDNDDNDEEDEEEDESQEWKGSTKQTMSTWKSFTHILGQKIFKQPPFQQPNRWVRAQQGGLLLPRVLCDHMVTFKCKKRRIRMFARAVHAERMAQEADRRFRGALPGMFLPRLSGAITSWHQDATFQGTVAQQPRNPASLVSKLQVAPANFSPLNIPHGRFHPIQIGYDRF